jgi:hypothetical protein
VGKLKFTATLCSILVCFVRLFLVGKGLIRKAVIGGAGGGGGGGEFL